MSSKQLPQLLVLPFLLLKHQPHVLPAPRRHTEDGGIYAVYDSSRGRRVLGGRPSNPGPRSTRQYKGGFLSRQCNHQYYYYHNRIHSLSQSSLSPIVFFSSPSGVTHLRAVRIDSAHCPQFWRYTRRWSMFRHFDGDPAVLIWQLDSICSNFSSIKATVHRFDAK
jgi:hypothetical protein